MRRHSLALTCCLGTAFLSPVAVARTETYDCIELITADADAVVRGTITGISALGTEADQSYRFKLVIRLAETLKGPKADEISVALHTADPQYDVWQERRAELLFSLRSMHGERPPCPFVLRAGQSAVELDGGRRGVVTMDFRRLTTRAEILEAARDGVRAAPDGTQKQRVRLTPPSSTKLSGDFQSVRVAMPADARLRKRAETWARSPSIELRCLAPLAFSSFKSNETILILKELLADDLHSDVADANGRGTRYYPVRGPAYGVLRKWRVAVEKPVTEEPRPLRFRGFAQNTLLPASTTASSSGEGRRGGSLSRSAERTGKDAPDGPTRATTPKTIVVKGDETG